MVENNQKVFTELIKSNRWNTIIGGISALIGATTSGILIWKTLKRSRINPKVRLIRQKGRIGEVELRHRDERTQLKLQQKAENDKMVSRQEMEMARELLKLDIIEREVKHEAKLRGFEVSLEKKEEKEILSNNNLLNNWKKKGEDLMNKGKEEVNKLKDKVKMN